jgi:hypothetical protein
VSLGPAINPGPWASPVVWLMTSGRSAGDSFSG